MRSKAKTEVTRFLDDEIGTNLDKLSRQVARIDKRLHTYHEVCVQERLSKVSITQTFSNSPSIVSLSLTGQLSSVLLFCIQYPHRYPACLFPLTAEHIYLCCCFLRHFSPKNKDNRQLQPN